MAPPSERSPKAIVLSGGGARGAYEAGVLSVLLERYRPGGEPLADFLCGTSIGAITGAWVGAMLDAPKECSRELLSMWATLSIEDVLAFGPGEVLSLPRLFLGGSKPTGLFRVGALGHSLGEKIPWRRLKEHTDTGLLQALTVTATHVRTGHPVVWLQRAPGVPHPKPIARRATCVDTAIGLDHVLASGAIPVLFPPVSIDGELYCEGGLRLNTPLGPAIRLGARRVLAIGLSTTGKEAEVDPKRYPGASFLLGKVLNAFLLDHVMTDLEELQRINRILEDGQQVWGPEFAQRLGEVASLRGEPVYQTVEPFVVRPSVDLSVLAADHLRRMRRRIGRVSAAKVLLQLLDTRQSEGSDIASYLLFDGAYARDLVDLGRRDALAQGDALDRFLAPG